MRRSSVAAGVGFVAMFATAVAAAGDDETERFDYVLNCAGCHLGDGSGSATVPKLTELAPILDVEGGRAYLARVPGVAQAPLSDDRLARLLNWVIENMSGLVLAVPYSAEEVGLLRADPLRAPEKERERLLGSTRR